MRALQYIAAPVTRLLSKLLLDTQQTVVFRRPLSPCRSARLDLARSRRDREVSDRRVLRLAAAVRDDARPARLARLIDRIERLRQRADLVKLDQHRVRRLLLDPPLDPLDVRDEDVVPYKLRLIADTLGQQPPACPVLLRHPVLDRDDGIAPAPVFP